MGEDILGTTLSWPWPSTILILLAAIFSVTIIFLSTQRAMRNMALETGRMVASIQAAQSKHIPDDAPDAVVTMGRGEVIWCAGGFKMEMARRLDPFASDLESAANSAVADLADALIALGVNAQDIVKSEPVHTPAGAGSVGVTILVREIEQANQIVETALAQGFRENHGGVREEITAEDAHNEAGERAIEDAINNRDTLARQLGLPINSLIMTSAELNTDDDACSSKGNGRVVKIARTRWRVAPDKT